jgi:carotenoid cleavage dioxygenase-like enzyme
VYHAGKLLALKEDSPPVAMHPLTLETSDDYLTFNGKLTSKTFTAHPKFDAGTGEMIGFGYEAKGLGSDDVAVYAIDKTGNITWEAWIKVPYVGMVHDFAVTQNHIAFLVIPMAFNLEQMKAVIFTGTRDRKGAPLTSWAPGPMVICVTSTWIWRTRTSSRFSRTDTASRSTLLALPAF